MKVCTSFGDTEIVDCLSAGGIGVLRTDTLYGLVADASNEAAVERVFQLKHRDDDKSPIVLIASTKSVFDDIGIYKTIVDTYWPGKVSIILPSLQAPEWLRRGNGSVAYRIPDSVGLLQLLEKTGPLIAPSANPQGKAPATTMQQAMDYFGDSVDFYVDGGTVDDDSPSALLRVIKQGTVEKLR